MGEYIPQDEYFEWDDFIPSYTSTSPAPFAKQSRKQVNLDISATPTPIAYEMDDLYDYDSDSELELDLTMGGFKLSSRHFGAETPNMTLKSLGSAHEEEHISLPSYDEEKKSLVASLSSASLTSLGSSQPIEAECVERAVDDTAILATPSKHVDFLSHDWNQCDLLATWKYLNTKSSRKTYNNSTRLINASWRLWTKERYQLETVKPISINWQKDRDTTWLYGPLHPGVDAFVLPETPEPCPTPASRSSSISSTASSSSIRPILKKPTLSEELFRRSISSAALAREAALAAEEARNLSQKNRTASLLSDLVNEVRKSLVESGIRRTNSNKSVRWHEDVVAPAPQHATPMTIDSLFESSSEEGSEDDEEDNNVSPDSFLTMLKSKSRVADLDLNQDSSSNTDSLPESMTSDSSSTTDSDDEAADDCFGSFSSMHYGQPTGLNAETALSRENLVLGGSMVKDQFALPVIAEEKVQPWVEQTPLIEKCPDWHTEIDEDEADWWAGV
ncbi:hypothetical protein HYFRA_00011379 [Hymenoscyphus fraxineus]|uniref:Nitrogen regulatory protein areA GATA-like domain-containing protein n=1 Tax=Hymenoscyphus fraxineus TaxID=746836 RepID=A0A9N9L0B6_9HELO|nr:hypothetical protein HYFRA_00011379 [Hymenoscyphus fraxineus]